MDSVFFKVVDFLEVINDLDKRGYKGTVLTHKLVDSLIASAVQQYNLEFASPPQQDSQPQPQPENEVNATQEVIEEAEVVEPRHPQKREEA